MISLGERVEHIEDVCFILRVLDVGSRFCRLDNILEPVLTCNITCENIEVENNFLVINIC